MSAALTSAPRSSFIFVSQHSPASKTFSPALQPRQGPLHSVDMSSNQSHASRLISHLLLLVVTFGTVAPVNNAARLQQTPRQRTVTTAPRSTAPAPTPKPTPQTPQTQTPTTQAPAQQTSTPTSTQTGAPLTPKPTTLTTPVAPVTNPASNGVSTPTAQPVAAPQTLEELRARIQERFAQPPFAASHLAAKIVSLDTGRTLFEQNASKWLQPASNMKLYTVAAALDRLSPDYRFTTSVYALARPDAAGTVRGDLIVYGRGDPTFAIRFTGGTTDYYQAIDELAARVVTAGVRRVEGDLIGDESYFAGGPLAPGWEWDDLQWYYGAEVSALSVNDNAVDIVVKPGLRAGDPCGITVGPLTPFVTIVDRTVTGPHGSPRQLSINRPLGSNVIEVGGSMPLDAAQFTASVAVTRPAMLFAAMLRTALERQGVKITGPTRTIDARARAAAPLPIGSLVEVANRQSPPLGVIAAQILKPSQNLYTELVLRALGKMAGSDPTLASDEAGIEAVRIFLTGAGIDPNSVVMIDGSGLSRGNLVTAEATLGLLTFMSRHRYANAFRDALPIAGVDGTLRTRMRNTTAAGNARAKTGTLSTSTTLSGYVTSAAGERLAFSLMVNNPPRETDPRAAFTDAITVLLASFAGRS